jgi:hypothetical protein
MVVRNLNDRGGECNGAGSPGSKQQQELPEVVLGGR